MATGSLKDRVAAEVARLKAKVEEQGQKAEQPWWEKIAGTFAGDPMYLEAMRLGRKYRNRFVPRKRGR